MPAKHLFEKKIRFYDRDNITEKELEDKAYPKNLNDYVKDLILKDMGKRRKRRITWPSRGKFIYTHKAALEIARIYTEAKIKEKGYSFVPCHKCGAILSDRNRSMTDHLDTLTSKYEELMKQRRD